MTDAVSDMIIRLKNAGNSHKETASFPYSKLKQEICGILEKEHYVMSSSRKGKKNSKVIEVSLAYDGKTPRIKGVKRISKPSRRVYKKVSEIRQVKNGYGILILSTPKGIMTGERARKEKIGGEALFEIW